MLRGHRTTERLKHPRCHCLHRLAAPTCRAVGFAKAEAPSEGGPASPAFFEWTQKTGRIMETEQHKSGPRGGARAESETGMGGGTWVPMILPCHDSVSFLWLGLRRAAFLRELWDLGI